MRDRQTASGDGVRGEYPVLRPGVVNPAFRGKCALAVMAKAPREGRVKTRLSPPLTLEESAALNACFLRDTTATIAEVCREVSSVGLICYTPVGDEAVFAGLLPEGFALIPQRGEGFGTRLLAAAEDILSCGFAAVCLIDSDSPTLPGEALCSAVAALTSEGAEQGVVIGPSADGGYYLIGMRRAHPQVFECISWSTGEVFSETLERCAAAGLDAISLPRWYDVDDAASLGVLQAELLEGKWPEFAAISGSPAVATREFLVARRGAMERNREASADEVVA